MESTKVVIERNRRFREIQRRANAVCRFNGPGYAIVPGYTEADARLWAKTLAERIRKADEQWAEEMYAVYDELQALIEEAKAPL